jgi:hypothetical protein
MTMTNPMLPATMSILRKLVDDIFVQLDGIPEDDLNSWLPRDGMRDVNTFYALAAHALGAGEFWILEAAGGRPVDRNRTAEFQASGSFEQLKERYGRWLEETAAVLATIDDATLTSVYSRLDDPERGMSATSRTRAECILHAVEHTGVHLGHLQLQRQLWDTEHSD